MTIAVVGVLGEYPTLFKILPDKYFAHVGCLITAQLSCKLRRREFNYPIRPSEKGLFDKLNEGAYGLKYRPYRENVCEAFIVNFRDMGKGNGGEEWLLRGFRYVTNARV